MTRLLHLVFVEAAEPWKRFSESLRQDAAEVIPATFDVGLANRWACEGRRHCNLWQYLDAADHAAIGELSTQLAETWCQPFVKSLCHGELHPVELSWRDMIPVFAWAATMQRAITRALREFRPAQLTLWSNLNRALAGYINADNDIAAAVFLHAAQRAGVKTTRLPVNAIAPYRESSSVARGSGNSQLLNRDLSDRDFFAGALNSDRSQTVCLQVCNHTDYQLQLSLREELDRRGICVISAIYGGGGMPDPVAGRLRLEPFLDLPWSNEALRQQVTIAWDAFVRQQPAFTGLGAELLGNPLLNFQFRQYFDNLLEGARWFEAVGQLADLIQPEMCLTGFDVIGLRRCAYEALRQRGIPTVQYQHGLICDFELHDFRSDYLLVPGELHKREHVKRGRPAERIIVVGDPAVTPAMVTPSAKLNGSVSSVSSPPAKILAITATIVFGSRHVNYDGHRHAQAWMTLAAAVAGRPGAKLLIKPHPRYDDFTLYHDLAATGHVQIVDRHRSLNTCLAEADLVVLVNATTSAVIHAMADQKPVVAILNAEAVPSSDANANLLRTSGMTIVSDLTELAVGIDRLLDDASARQEALDRQNEFLSKFVAFRAADALGQMADFMNSLIKSGQVHRKMANEEALLAWQYIANNETSKLTAGAEAVASASHNGTDIRAALARRIASWMALWSWQYIHRLRDENALLRGVQMVGSALALDWTARRRLEGAACRAEALRCEAQGDISGMRRHAWSALVRQNPFTTNRDLSRMMIASLLGPTPKSVLKKLKSWWTASRG